MSRIVISGYYGFGNAGDEAMLTSMIEALSDVDPNVKITVISGNPAETHRRHGVASVFRLNLLAIAKAIASCDLLISGGGSLLQDVTSKRSLYYYLGIVFLAKRLGKPVMLYAQGIGPVRGETARKAMRHLGNQVDMITVRDEGSQAELADMGIRVPPVHLTADAVLALHPVDRDIGRMILRRQKLEGASPLVGISPRAWKDWDNYKQVMAETADHLIREKGARVVFLPMQWPDDIEAARSIMKRMKEKAVLLEDGYNTAELLSLVGNLDLLIGVRLHALIFAAVMQVPIIGVSYDPKIDRFMESLGEKPVGALDDVTTGAMVERLDRIWPQLRQQDKVREERIGHLRSLAFRNAELAMTLLKERR